MARQHISIGSFIFDTAKYTAAMGGNGVRAVLFDRERTGFVLGQSPSADASYAGSETRPISAGLAQVAAAIKNKKKNRGGTCAPQKKCASTQLYSAPYNECLDASC